MGEMKISGRAAAEASTFQHSPMTRFRRARPFWEGQPQETAIASGRGDPISAKRGRRRVVHALSHCSLVNVEISGPNGSLDGWTGC